MVNTQLAGKNILITGGTGGIGKQTAIGLAKKGARIFISGRSMESGKTAIKDIINKTENENVELVLGDLLTQKGVYTLAEQITGRLEKLDVLINNAGLAASKRLITADGFESDFAVNTAAPFLLTQLLMDLLQASGHGRVINVTGGDLQGRIEHDNIQAEREFNGLKTYSHSKLVMMAMSVEFASRVQGTAVTINTCYPGQASTNMTRSVTKEMLPAGMGFLLPVFRLLTRDDGGRSAERASRSSVYLASARELEGINGKYFNSNCQPAAWPVTVLDPENRELIWGILSDILPGK